MIFKEKLIPKIYVEVSGRDIPKDRIIELETLLHEINFCRYNQTFHFEEWEYNLKDSLVELDLIEYSHTNFSKHEYTIKDIDKMKKFFEDFWNIYNELDEKSLSRERVLKEMELDKTD